MRSQQPPSTQPEPRAQRGRRGAPRGSHSGGIALTSCRTLTATDKAWKGRAGPGARCSPAPARQGRSRSAGPRAEPSATKGEAANKRAEMTPRLRPPLSGGRDGAAARLLPPRAAAARAGHVAAAPALRLPRTVLRRLRGRGSAAATAWLPAVGPAAGRQPRQEQEQRAAAALLFWPGLGPRCSRSRGLSPPGSGLEWTRGCKMQRGRVRCCHLKDSEAKQLGFSVAKDRPANEHHELILDRFPQGGSIFAW